jgi:predicted phosphoribosyltransferase
VAYDVAQALAASLDMLLVRKLGFRGREDLAIGAVTSSGIHVLNKRALRSLYITESQLGALVRAAEQDLVQRERHYRDSRPARPARDRTVLLIDDGSTTGLTMRAATKAIQQQGPRRVVVGVPTATLAAYATLKAEVDEVVSVITPDPFWTVGTWYSDFSSVSDNQVQQLLSRAERKHLTAVCAY